VIPRGTFCQVNYPGLTAAIVKLAKVVTGGSTSAPRVTKNTLFQAGDIVMKLDGTAGVTVTAIDRSNADYDVLTLSAAISGLAADDFIVEADAVGSSAAQKYEANAVVESTKEIKRATDETVSACDHVRVLEGVVYPVPQSFKVGLALKNNPTITFIYQ
jgi:hypothetical protein